ncbi:MAG TPA: hypothetical protein VK638_47270, partial [Edaphobacter sp.]|nr:hypothetical protein [Edaphobacter sp.]
MSKLQGKIAVITGGNSGIGLATAAEFVAKAHMSSSPVILFGITAPIGAVMPTPAWQRRYRLGLFPSQPGRMPDGGIVLLCGAGVPGFTAYSA